MPASQLRLMRDQLRRSPVVVLLIDVFLAWLLMRAGHSAWILGWVALSSVLQLGRLWDIQRLVVREADAQWRAYRRTPARAFGALTAARWRRCATRRGR